MSGFGGNVARVLSIVIDVKSSPGSGRTFDQIERLLSRIEQQKARIQSLGGAPDQAIATLESAAKGVDRVSRDGSKEEFLRAAAEVNKLELAAISVRKQQTADILAQADAEKRKALVANDYRAALGAIESAEKRLNEIGATGFKVDKEKLGLEIERLQVLRQQERFGQRQVAATATAQIKTARLTISESQLLAQQGDTTGAIRSVQQARAKVTPESEAGIALLKRELQLRDEIRKQEAQSAQRRAAEEQQARRDLNERIRLEIKAAELLAQQGDAPRGLAVLRAASNDADPGSNLSIALQKKQIELAGQVRREEAAATAARIAGEKESQRQLLARTKLEVGAAVGAKDYNAAIQAIERAQTRLVAGSEAFIRLENQKNKLIADRIALEQREEKIQVQRSIAESKLLAQRGDRVGSLGLLQNQLASTKDGDQQLRIRSEIARQEAAITGELEKQKGVFGTILGFGNDLVKIITRTLSTFFLISFAIKSVGDAILNFTVRPMLALGKEVLKVTDEFRRLEITFSGITGSLRSSRDLVKDIVAAGRGLPITPLEAIAAVRQTAFVPSVANRLAEPSGRPQFLADLERTLVGLSTINPQQGTEGAGFAVREALAGQFRSIRTRFDVSPDVIAASVGKRIEDLRRDPELTLRAITAFVDSFVGPDTLNELQNSLETQGVKFKGLLQNFFRKIGEVDNGTGGFFDSVVTRFRSFNDELGNFLNPTSKEGEEKLRITSARISLALSNFFDSILDMASGIISSLSGKQINLREAIEAADFDKITQVFASAVEGIGRLAADVLAVATTIASAAASVAAQFLPDPEETRKRLLDKALGNGPIASRKGTGALFAARQEIDPASIPAEELNRLISQKLSAKERAELNLADSSIALNRRFASPSPAVASPATTQTSPPIAPARSREDVFAQQILSRSLQESGVDENGLRDRVGEMSRTIGLRIIALRKLVEGQIDGLSQDDADTPRTIESATNGLRLALSNAIEGPNGIAAALDAANDAIRPIDDVSAALRNRLESFAKSEKGTPAAKIAESIGGALSSFDSITNGLRTAIKSAAATGPIVSRAVAAKIGAVFNETKELGLDDQVREVAAIFDDIFAIQKVLEDERTTVGPQLDRSLRLAEQSRRLQSQRPEQERGGTGILSIIPPSVAAGRFGDILSINSATAQQIIGSSEASRAASIAQRTQKLGFEDVRSSIDATKRSISELQRFGELVSAGVISVPEDQVKAVQSAVKRAVDTASADLVRLERTAATIVRNVDRSILDASRQIEDARLGEQEQAARQTFDDRQAIVDRNAIALARTRLDIDRQRADLIRNFATQKDLGFPETGGDSSQALRVFQAQLRSLQEAGNARTRQVQSTGDFELFARDRQAILDAAERTNDAMNELLTERERIINESNAKIRRLELDRGNESNDIVSSFIDQQIQIEREGLARRLRVQEEADAQQKGGFSQVRAFDRLLGGSELGIGGTSDGRFGANAPRDIGELNRLIGLVNARADSQIRLADIGAPGGEATDEAGRQAVDRLQRIKDLVSNQEFIDALSLNGVDFTDFVDRLTQAEKEIEDKFSKAREASKSLANGISADFDGVLSDVLIDALRNKGQNIADIFKDLGYSILKTVTQTVEDILVVQTLINPLLNSAFGTNLSTTSAGRSLFASTPSSISSINSTASYGLYEGGLIKAAYGVLSRTNGTVLLADGRIAQTVEDGSPEAHIPMANGGSAIIPMRGGGVPVRMGADGEASIPLASAPFGKIPARVIRAAEGAWSGVQDYRTPSSERGRWPQEASRRQPEGGSLALTIVNTVDSEQVVRSGVARSPNTIVNPVVKNAGGNGVVRRTIRSVRR